MQGNAARSRYSQSFQSSIFEPLPTPQGPVVVPAGKRRDLTTEEMWGTHVEKDLKAAPKTFAPRDPGISAKQRFLKSLVTGVLPGLPGAGPEAEALPPSREGLAEQPAPDEELAAAADGDARSLERSGEADEGAHPEPGPQGGRSPPPPPWDDMTHAERSYMQKCSGLFNRPSPADAGDVHREALRQRREEDLAGQRARRADPRYSDIFHRRAAPGAEHQARWRAAPEDRIGVHMDWTDSKTELIGARRPQTADGPRAAGGAARRGDSEFRGTVDILDPTRSPHDGAHRELQPVTEDNSHKLKSSCGSSTSQIHQAHLRSSLLSDAFYSEAESAKHWRVVELHVSGLPRVTGNEDMVRKLCQGLDLQIVRVLVEMDPVHNLCKGRAKIVVRYNPDRDNLDSLVDQLQAANLRVSM